MRAHILLPCLLLFAALYWASAKHFTTSISVNQLSREPWKYLTKFGMEIGVGGFKMRARLTKAHAQSAQSDDARVYALIYYDVRWQLALQ